MKKPQPFEKYKHFKGKEYQVLVIAKHSETGEELVIYQALYGEFRVYARPLSMFLEKLDKGKYIEAKQEYRFEPVPEPEPIQTAVQSETVPMQITKPSEQESEYTLDPMVVQFLDADSYEDKLNLLTGLHHRITDDMINVMAIASDIEIPEGEIEIRFQELKNCLLKFDKFEGSRIR